MEIKICFWREGIYVMRKYNVYEFVYKVKQWICAKCPTPKLIQFNIWFISIDCPIQNQNGNFYIRYEIVNKI